MLLAAGEGDDVAAAVHAGSGVRGRRELRGLPVAGGAGGGGGAGERDLGHAAPVAQHPRLLVGHRRLRPHRLQAHPQEGRRRAHARVPVAPEQVNALYFPFFTFPWV